MHQKKPNIRKTKGVAVRAGREGEVILMKTEDQITAAGNIFSANDITKRVCVCVCVFLPRRLHFHSSKHLLFCPRLLTERWPVTAGVSGGEGGWQQTQMDRALGPFVPLNLLKNKKKTPSALQVWSFSSFLNLKWGITHSSSSSSSKLVKSFVEICSALSSRSKNNRPALQRHPTLSRMK